MDSMSLPLDVANALVAQYGNSASHIALSRAETALRGGDMKAHDHALMVLTEIEEIARERVMVAGAGPTMAAPAPMVMSR